MIPLLPDFSAAIAPLAMPQPGGAPLGGGVGGLDFAGLLGAALPRAPASRPDAALPSALAGPVPTNKVPEAPASSLPPGSLPALQPLLQAQPQPQTKTQSKAEPQAQPLTVPLAAPGALSLGPVPLPPGGTPLPPSGDIVPGAAFTKSALPDLPQPDVASQPMVWVKPVLPEKQFAENADAPVATASLTAPIAKLGAETLEAVTAPEEAAPAAATKLPSAPPAPLVSIPLSPPVPPPSLRSPWPVTKGALTLPASQLAAETEGPVLDTGLAEPSALVPSSLPMVMPTIAPLLPPAPSDPRLLEAPAQAELAAPAFSATTATPAPIQPPPAGVVRRGVAVGVQSEAGAVPLPPTVSSVARSEPGLIPQFTPRPSEIPSVASPSVPVAPSAPSTPVIAAASEIVGDAVLATAPAPNAPLPPAALAQRPEPRPKDIGKVVTTSPAKDAAPAFNPLVPPPAAPVSDAASPPPSLAPGPVQAPASPPPTAMPAAPVIIAVPEPSAAPEPARAAPSPQLEQTITAVGDLREALRAARPEMTLRHAEFGAVSLRLEAAGAQDWRVVLASRDPGFVPAIQAALVERAVAAAAETSLGAGQQGGQNGSGEPRYGSSLGSGQGGSQPYSGQQTSRDEGGLAHHQQQRQQRGSGTSAAADAGSQAGDGAPREQGLFA